MNMLWLVVVLAICVLIFGLNRMFPDVLGSEDAQAHLLYLVMLLTVCSGALVHYRGRLGTGVRHAAIWLGLGVLLVVGYSFRDELAGRLRGELLPSTLIQTGDRAYAVRAANDGHFYITAHVDRTPVRFMVDTGASQIILTRTVAARLGIPVDSLEFTHPFSTANGTSMCARATLERLTIGPQTFTDVDVFVSKGGLDAPLLGMSLLKRLRAFRFEGHQLILTF